MISVAIVGTGNVGFHLNNELAKSDDLNVIQFNSRSQNSLTDFDIAILAVSDDAISEVSKNIESKLVVHTSGTTDINLLKNSHNKGVFYPLQSFSKQKEVDFSHVPLCIEAENKEDLELLETLGKSLKSKTYIVNSEQRKHLHLAAVFANNFSNHMFTLAEEICNKNNVPFEVLKPLIQETTKKIETLSPAKAQTGPAARGDQKTIENHLELLDTYQQELYLKITQSIKKYG